MKALQSLIEYLKLLVHQTQHQTLHRMRSVRPVSVTYYGVHTRHANSNVSMSGGVHPVVHYRSTHGIGRRRASGGPRPVTLRKKHPLCVWVRCASDTSGAHLRASDVSTGGGYKFLSS